MGVKVPKIIIALPKSAIPEYRIDVTRSAYSATNGPQAGPANTPDAIGRLAERLDRGLQVLDSVNKFSQKVLATMAFKYGRFDVLTGVKIGVRGETGIVECGRLRAVLRISEDLDPVWIMADFILNILKQAPAIQKAQKPNDYSLIVRRAAADTAQGVVTGPLDLLLGSLQVVCMGNVSYGPTDRRAAAAVCRDYLSGLRHKVDAGVSAAILRRSEHYTPGLEATNLIWGLGMAVEVTAYFSLKARKHLSRK